MKTLVRSSVILIVVTLMLSAVPDELWAQITDSSGVAEGIRGAPRSLKYDARTIALGDATVADPTDLTAININPATLSFVRNSQAVHINIFQNWRNNLMLENLTIPAFHFDNHSVTAQFTLHHGGSNVTNFLGSNPLPEPNLTMLQIDMAYAYSIENTLSFGILGSASYAETEVARFWTFSPSLGMIYAPSQSISYGIAFRGLGRSVVYQFVGDGITALGSQNLRESLELGATLQFPVDTDRTYLSLSLSNEKRFGENGIWYKAGLELKLLPPLAIRSGLLFQPEDAIYAPRFGVGISGRMVRFDFSISPSSRLYERFHQFGLILQF